MCSSLARPPTCINKSAPPRSPATQLTTADRTPRSPTPAKQSFLRFKETLNARIGLPLYDVAVVIRPFHLLTPIRQVFGYYIRHVRTGVRTSQRQRKVADPNRLLGNDTSIRVLLLGIRKSEIGQVNWRYQAISLKTQSR